MTRWPLQDAKNQFSEVVNKAIDEGPQLVTKHGEEAVVVISIEEYRKLVEPETSLVEFFSKSPLAKAGLNLDRDKDEGRKVDL